MGKRRKRIGLRAHIASATNYLAKNLNRRSIRRFVTRTIRDAQDGFAGAVGDTGPQLSRGAMGRAQRLANNAGGGAARVFGVSTTPRSWSPLTKNLANKILRMGANVPVELQQAAQDAVDGVGNYRNERELQEILRGGLGIHRSGASALTRSVNRVRRGFSELQRGNLLFNQASQGGLGGGVAGAGLVEMGLDKAESVVRSKFVEKMAIGFAKAVGQDPTKYTKLLFAVGRGLRLGGAIGAIAQTVLSVGQERISQQQQSADSRLSSYRAGKAYGVDAKLARDIRRSSSSEEEHTAFGIAKGLLGFNAKAEKERAENATDAFKLTKESRDMAGRLGINVAAVLEREASIRGKSVEDLSEVEINRALDPLTLSAARALVPKSSIDSELNKRGFNQGGVEGNARKIVSPVAELLGIDVDKEANQERREAAAKSIETKTALEILENMKLEAANATKARQGRNADVPPPTLRFQGQGGEVFEYPNPLYEQYRLQKGTTVRQVRTFVMNRDATLKRKQVVWVD